jgi:hypothetical protein
MVVTVGQPVGKLRFLCISGKSREDRDVWEGKLSLIMLTKLEKCQFLGSLMGCEL